jgi:ribonuclease R
MKNKKHTSHKNEQKLLDLGRKILRFMNQKTSKIYNYKQIAEGIDYKNPRQRELVIQALHRLLATQKIKETEKGKYIVNLNIEGTLTGTIDFNQSGNAYVKVEGLEDDIFIHQKNVKDALQGDKVLIITYNYKGKKLEGSVVEVLERAKETFVGTFQKIPEKDFGFVVFDKKVINTDMFISRNHFNNAEDGDKVVVKMLNGIQTARIRKAKLLPFLALPENMKPRSILF